MTNARRATSRLRITGALALLAVLSTGCGSVSRAGIRNNLDYHIFVTTGDEPLQQRWGMYVRAHETAHEVQSDVPNPGCRDHLRVYRTVIADPRYLPADTPAITDQVTMSADQQCAPSSGRKIITASAKKQ